MPINVADEYGNVYSASVLVMPNFLVEEIDGVIYIKDTTAASGYMLHSTYHTIVFGPGWSVVEWEFGKLRINLKTA